MMPQTHLKLIAPDFLRRRLKKAKTLHPCIFPLSLGVHNTEILTSPPLLLDYIQVQAVNFLSDICTLHVIYASGKVLWKVIEIYFV